MAYTKAPTENTHNVVRLETKGNNFLVTDNSNTFPSGITPTTLNYIDCFPLTEKQWGKEGKKAIHKRDAWKSVATSSGAPLTSAASLGGRVIVSETEDSVHFCTFNSYYRLSGVTGVTPVLSSISGAGAGAWYCGGTLAVDNTNANRVCFMDNSGQLFTWLENGSGLTTTAVVGPTGFRNLVFLNGYLFAAAPDGKIYNSNPGGVLTTWNATNFIVPEIYPDTVQWLETHKNYLVAFGSNTTEFFYDGAIEVGSPLARQESYTSRVGIVTAGVNGRNQNTAKINDDIYFVGKNISNTRALYRIRDFRVEEISDQFFTGALNWVGSTTAFTVFNGIQSTTINNNPMIIISLTNNTYTNAIEYVYFPDEDVFWQMETSTTPSATNTDFPGYGLRIGQTFNTTFSANAIYQPTQLYVTSSGATAVSVLTPNYARDVSITSKLYTEVFDLGINRYKHIARMDAIGDYGDNTLSLAYNPSPNYQETYVNCTPDVVPSTIGYENNISWYNLGAYRRMSFKFTMAGIGPGIHEAFDIEYNLGVS
jgi:hypothetical protein